MSIIWLSVLCLSLTQARPTDSPALRLALEDNHGHDGGHIERVKQVPLSDAWPGLLMATIAGASTVLGGLIVCLLDGSPSARVMAFSLSLAAGVMLTVAFEMLFPQGDHGHGHHGHGHHGDNHGHGDAELPWQYVILFFGIGCLSCWLLCKLADCVAKSKMAQEGMEETLPGSLLASEVAIKNKQQESWRLAFLLFTSLTAHNLPEGFAVAVTAISSRQLGLILCVAIALHNIPEGIAIAVSTYDATGSKYEAVRMTAYSGLSEPAGALLAILLLQAVLTPMVLAALMTVVAGVMGYIACVELMPEAVSKGEHVATAVGFLSGIAVMVVTHELVHYMVDDHE